MDQMIYDIVDELNLQEYEELIDDGTDRQPLDHDGAQMCSRSASEKSIPEYCDEWKSIE